MSGLSLEDTFIETSRDQQRLLQIFFIVIMILCLVFQEKKDLERGNPTKT